MNNSWYSRWSKRKTVNTVMVRYATSQKGVEFNTTKTWEEWKTPENLDEGNRRRGHQTLERRFLEKSGQMNIVNHNMSKYEWMKKYSSLLQRLSWILDKDLEVMGISKMLFLLLTYKNLFKKGKSERKLGSAVMCTILEKIEKSIVCLTIITLRIVTTEIDLVEQ